VCVRGGDLVLHALLQQFAVPAHVGLEHVGVGGVQELGVRVDVHEVLVVEGHIVFHAWFPHRSAPEHESARDSTLVATQVVQVEFLADFVELLLPLGLLGLLGRLFGRHMAVRSSLLHLGHLLLEIFLHTLGHLNVVHVLVQARLGV